MPARLHRERVDSENVLDLHGDGPIYSATSRENRVAPDGSGANLLVARHITDALPALVALAASPA